MAAKEIFFNQPARRAYERVGLRNVGTFASVLF